MWKYLVLFLCSVAPANANWVALDFNEFATPWNYDFSLPYRADYTPYTRDNVTLSSASVLETYWAHQYPDALLANYQLNGSGILSVRNTFEITTGSLFKLDSVDLLSGLYNPGMSVIFDGFRDGLHTASVQVFFPPADPSYFAAYIGDMSWVFGFDGASLGIVDRLMISSVAGHRGNNSFFADNLVVHTQVPEPDTLALMILGLAGAFFMRHRSRLQLGTLQTTPSI
jgi:hypothetical protein